MNQALYPSSSGLEVEKKRISQVTFALNSDYAEVEFTYHVEQPHFQQ